MGQMDQMDLSIHFNRNHNRYCRIDDRTMDSLWTFLIYAQHSITSLFL